MFHPLGKKCKLKILKEALSHPVGDKIYTCKAMRLCLCACLVASFAVARGKTGTEGSSVLRVNSDVILYSKFRHGTAVSKVAYSICKISHPTELDSSIFGPTALSKLLTTMNLDHEVNLHDTITKFRIFIFKLQLRTRVSF